MHLPLAVENFITHLDTHLGAFLITLPSNERFLIGQGSPVGELRINSWNAIERLFTSTDQSIAFGEAFAASEVDLYGNTTAILWALYFSGSRWLSPFHQEEKEKRASAVSSEDSQANVEKIYHGHEQIYDAFLDKKARAYSAAVFDTELTAIDETRQKIFQASYNADNNTMNYAEYEKQSDVHLSVNQIDDNQLLEKAQLKKYSLTARKALSVLDRILPPDSPRKILELGCGWGGFSKILSSDSRNYIDAITLSQSQAEHAKKTIDNFQVNVQVCDYQHVPESTKYDAIISIGMLEHVGRNGLDELSSFLSYRSKPTGIVVLQTIIATIDIHMNPFLSKYIFPGAHLHTLPNIVAAFEKAGLVIRHIETWDRQYAWTLQIWESNWLRNKMQVLNALKVEFQKETTDEATLLFWYRLWWFYFIVARASFLCGSHRSAQIVLVKPENVQAFPFGRPLSI
jgi:cyclopropane fatty-acyl-phospholipid synthase-like methyltransferase